MDDEQTADTSATTADTSFDTSAADVIAEIAADWEANPPPPEEGDEEVAAAAEAADPNAPQEEAEAPADTSAEVNTSTEGEDSAQSEDSERGLERLVAREVALREQETALKARESRVAALETENAALKQQLSAYPQDFVADMAVRPWDSLEAAGHDPDQTLRLLLVKKFEKDGKAVPPELRAAVRDAQQEDRIRRQEQRIIQFEQQQAAAAFVAQVEAGARQYVSTIGESKHVPLVARAAKTNPDRVHQEILDEIARDAQARAGKDPNAPLMTYADAAARVEARWSEMSALFGNPAASTPAPEKTSTQGAQKTSSSVKTPKSAAPPAKPLVKSAPKTATELEKMAIEEGVQEYRRVEAARRAARS
jgi:hypothetical protein